MEKTCFLICFTLFSMYYFLGNIAMAVTDINTDQSALLALKAHITNDPHNVLTTNWSTNSSVCNWIGVTCGTRHQRVTALNLGFMGLTGTIPPHLGNLSFLSLLSITNNSFYSTLPGELAKMRRLKYLNFRYNDFSIEIPSWIGSLSKLEYLFLDGNNFIGTIPPSICNLSSLQEIYLSFNRLSGSIPSTIFNISSLRLFFLDNNQLSGPMPSIISNMSSLQTINIAHNSLSGSLPVDLFNHLPNLAWLSLSYNQLHGQIPSSLFECKRLQGLSLSYNNFTGTIRKEFGNLTMLQQLYLGDNSLGGAIPSELANLRDLERLSLFSNSLTGPIPFELFNVSALQVISLTQNQLSGSLPSSLGIWLPNLQQLLLGGNMLIGSIPISITNASNLAILALEYNSFSGLIPSTFGELRLLQFLSLAVNNLTASTPDLSFLSSLASCKDLRKLVLSGNPLNGMLPTSIGNLSTTLEIFALAVCNIKGSIPREMGNFSNLIVLSLQINELTGPIPNSIENLQKLQGLYLHNNELQGSVPTDLCNLESLAELYLDNNKLDGLLPACWDNLISLRTLSLGSNKLNSIIPSTLWSLESILSINLSSNALNGSIPLEIENLKVVTQIDLSRNQLSGNIPTTIGGLKDLSSLSLAGNRLQGPILESLDGLVSLEYLDLSSNNLSGSIPKSLEALLYLKYLNLSFNRLQGEIPTGGPFANFSAQSFMSNDALCGAPRLQVPPCKSSTLRRSKKTFVLVLIIVLPVLTSVVLCLVLALIRCRKRSTKQPNQADMLPLATWKRISYRELQQAADGFSERNLLGVGSFGSVYKGTLPDGTNVAIKVFNLQHEGAFMSFDAECEVLRNTRHRNLVRIISSCSNHDFKALVLEFMPNGSLEKWLYSDNYSLDILQRLNIMIDVASALEYLHFDYSTTIVHCDIKPSNVLLDQAAVAHLSDFGISKLLSEGESMTQTQTLATIGYMAPEYGREGQVSGKGDVYSYGIMLMETFTRKKPTDEIFAGEVSLKQWVSDSLHGSIIEVADPNLIQKGNEHFAAKEQCLSSIFNLAIDCTDDSPEKRINANDAVTRLMKIRTNFLQILKELE